MRRMKNNNKATNNSVSLSLDGKDTSVGTMLGNHLNESTLDQEQSSDLAITPARWMRGTDGQSQLSCGDDRSGDGASGVLSFLGESPLFDRSVAEEDEAERTLSRSAEKVNNLEERLLRSASSAATTSTASAPSECVTSATNNGEG
mmetsp:Transcript_9554/g.20753  ORF Transcript_9554/g.20753 Transcript_9554/m.20753 type:complete len:146 (+) Transcript_9554:775-1212(+)